MLDWQQFFDAEEDAVLLVHRQTVVEVFVPLASVPLSAPLLFRLRKLSPVLHDLPLDRLRETIASSPRLALGAFRPDEAGTVQQDLRAAGFAVEVVAKENQFCSPFDVRLGYAVLMIDAPTTEAMARQMAEDGVPIRPA